MSLLLEMFTYPFILRAFVVGILVALCAALLGVPLVLKRYSMIGDGLSHVSFGALAVAVALGFTPLYFSIPVVILAALGTQLRRIYTARLAIDSGKDKYWLMELWEMKSDYPAKLLLSAAKKTTAAWCADAVKMCQVLDRRMKSEKGVDAVGELKLLLVRLGAQRR